MGPLEGGAMLVWSGEGVFRVRSEFRRQLQLCDQEEITLPRWLSLSPSVKWEKGEAASLPP